MNRAIEIRKTPDGRVQARRLDGQPMTDYDKARAKRLAQEAELPPRAWVVEEMRSESGALRAVMICSAVLDAHLWLIIDRTFEPRDELAIYYSEELNELRNKTPEQLKLIHQTKLAFPGCRVIQEGPEKG